MTSPAFARRPSPVRLDHDLCVLELPSDFRAVPNLDEYQFSFESELRKASVVLSILPVDIPANGLQAFAEIFVLARKAAEVAARSNFRLGAEDSSLTPDGATAHVAFAGADDDCVFRFLGWAMDHKFVSLWIGIEGDDDNHCVRVMNDVFAGLRI